VSDTVRNSSSGIRNPKRMLLIGAAVGALVAVALVVYFVFFAPHVARGLVVSEEQIQLPNAAPRFVVVLNGHEGKVFAFDALIFGSDEVGAAKAGNLVGSEVELTFDPTSKQVVEGDGAAARASRYDVSALKVVSKPDLNCSEATRSATTLNIETTDSWRATTELSPQCLRK